MAAWIVFSLVFSTVLVIGVVAGRSGEVFVALGILLLIAGLSSGLTGLVKLPEFLLVSVIDEMDVKDEYGILPTLIPRTLVFSGALLVIFGAIQLL